ncbi:MAG: tetratricopeptide repeat protein, partial [Gammaproteobacteria bacterium]
MSNLQHQIEQLIQQSDVSQALVLCGQECRRHPADPEVWQLQAQLQLRVGDYKSAVKSLERLVRLEPDNTAAWFNMGVAALKQGRMQRGKESLARVIDLDPKRVDAVLALVEVHKHNKNYDSALRILRDGLKASPDDIRLNWLLGLCLQDIGRLTEGMMFFGKACRMMRCMPATDTDVYPTRDAPGETFKNTAAHKLQHDMEQFEYLVDKGLLPPEYHDEAEKYRNARGYYETGGNPAAIAPLTSDDQARIGGTYNRMVYDSSRGQQRARALNAG